MEKRMHLLLLLFLIIFCFSSCGSVLEDSKDDSDNVMFQSNSEDFKILEVFDGWGSLEEIWDSIDGKGANEHLITITNENTDEFVTFAKVAGNILKDPELVPSLLSTDVRNILGHLIDPAEYYRKTPGSIGAFYNEDGDVYAAGFYSLLDKLWEGDNRPGDQQLIDIIEKVVAHIRDGKTNPEIKEDMQELIDDILDDDFDDDFHDISELIGKLLIRADYPMWVDENGSVLKRDNIDSANTNHRNLEIGNTVKGINEFTSWLNSMLANVETREYIYNAIRESVKMFDTEETSPNSHKVRQLLSNINDLFLVGGAIYETDPIYKSLPTDPTYTDTELGQTIREFLPHATQLLMRSDRPNSMIVSEDGSTPVYLLRETIDLLKNVGFNPDDLSIEDSLNNMMRHDQWGRDRLDANSGAYDASHLDSLLFLTNIAGNFGWTDGGDTGEMTIATDPTNDHGHGEFTGVLSVNDSLISLTTHKTLGLLGIYDIGMLESQKDHVSRSYVPFTTAQRDSYQFDYNPGYGVLRSMPGTCSGYIGTPDGGNATGDTPALNSYVPFNPTGLGDAHLGAWTVNWAARACIGGEGPYYYEEPDAEIVSFGGKDYYKYLRPDGKIYAFVNKDNETWEYIYPTDEKDGEDPETNIIEYNGKRQRFNRFKSTWYSDYYISHTSLLGANYYRTIDNSSGNVQMVNLSNGETSRRLTYNEVIPEDDGQHIRACQTPEEALFRNFQWCYTEKKMVIILPQYLNLLSGIGGTGVVYMVFECNGFSGLANMRKYEENHIWAKKGTNGLSDIPGDYRIELVADIFGLAALALSESSIYESTLGTGHGTPTVVGRNLPSLYRLGFPLSPEMDRDNDVIDLELGSREFDVNDSIWQSRSAVMPIIVSLWGAIMNNTPPYEVYQEKLSDSVECGLRSHINGIAALVKPLVYYEKNGAGTVAPYNSWKMRVQGSPVSQGWVGDQALKPAIGFPGDFTWNGSEAEQLHYQPKTVKTLVNILVDSDITAPVEEGKRFDGILPLMAENTGITNLVKALMSDANNSDNLYSSLEQITGAVKYTKGEMTKIYGDPAATKKIHFPEWLFATGTGTGDFGEYLDFENVRDEDIILDETLDKLFGHKSIPDHEGYGLANYVEEQNSDNWVQFYEDIDKIEDFIYPDSPYSLTESVIDLIDAVFARETVYSDAEIKALLYSVGKLFTYYDTTANRWVTQGDDGFKDIYNIFKLRLPAIHEIVKDDTGDNYAALLSINAEMLKDNGMLELILDTASTDDGAEMILRDLYAFLGDDISTQHDPLWSTLSNLLLDMAEAIENSNGGELLEEIYGNYGFQINE